MKKNVVPESSRPIVCGNCMDIIDKEWLLSKIRLGKRVVHRCGKVLNEGKEEERRIRDRQTAQDWGEVKDREWGRGA